MSVKSKLMPLMQAVQKDKSLSSLPSLKEMSDLYKGEGQDDTSIHALQKLANGLRAKFSVTDKLSIDDMTKLFQQPATGEVLLWENKNFNVTSTSFTYSFHSFTLNGDSRLLHPYKLKFKFHTVSSRSGDGGISLDTDPPIDSYWKSFAVSSDGDQDHEIVFDIPKGTKSATYRDKYFLETPKGCSVTTMAIYAIFPQDHILPVALMNGDTLACRADQEDDYDVHMTYAIKMQDLKLALVVVAENVTSTRAFLCQLLDQLIYLENDIIYI